MLNLWQGDAQQRILSGELVIQCGTWVLCGNDPHPSRYVGTNGRTLHVAHYPRTSGNDFSRRVALHKLSTGQKLTGKQLALVKDFIK